MGNHSVSFTVRFRFWSLRWSEVWKYICQFTTKMESAEETSKIDSGLPEPEEIIETETSWSEKKDEEEVSNVDDVDDELQETSGVSAYGMSAASGTNAAASKRGLPKLREIMRRQKQNSEVSPHLDFEGFEGFEF